MHTRNKPITSPLKRRTCADVCAWRNSVWIAATMPAKYWMYTQSTIWGMVMGSRLVISLNNYEVIPLCWSQTGNKWISHSTSGCFAFFRCLPYIINRHHAPSSLSMLCPSYAEELNIKKSQKSTLQLYSAEISGSESWWYCKCSESAPLSIDEDMCRCEIISSLAHLWLEPKIEKGFLRRHRKASHLMRSSMSDRMECSTTGSKRSVAGYPLGSHRRSVVHGRQVHMMTGDASTGSQPDLLIQKPDTFAITLKSK